MLRQRLKAKPKTKSNLDRLHKTIKLRLPTGAFLVAKYMTPSGSKITFLTTGLCTTKLLIYA